MALPGNIVEDRLNLNYNNEYKSGTILGGNVGVGTVTPSAKLVVNGTVRLGVDGTVLNKIIKVVSTFDLAAISGNTSFMKTISIPNVKTGSSIVISPSADLDDGLKIAYARISADGTV
jgi:hypothetical protein